MTLAALCGLEVRDGGVSAAVLRSPRTHTTASVSHRVVMKDLV